MCRWMAYIGNPVSLDALMFTADHNIVVQSLKSLEGAEPTNGDGFGVGWYQPLSSEPFLFRSVEPAWHDRNLKEIARAIHDARVVLAHVRAASPSVATVQQTNCHPFRHEKWLWMHNGVIRGFSHVKRDIMLRIDPDLFPKIQGSTDSETFFYLALSFGLKEDPPQAVAKAVGFIIELGKARDIQNPIQMTVATTDGERLWAFRYSSEAKSRTLYYSSDKHSILSLYPNDDAVSKRLSVFTEESRFVVSEPLADLPGVWNPVPESTCIYIDGPSLTMTPFEPITVET